MSYKGFGYVVDSCPLSKEKTTEAATRLNCSDDVYGRSQYVCVPNENLTAVVEFCYTKSVVGLYQAGYCLKTIKDGFLDQISCKNFTEGCPTAPYRSTELYKYPACSRLNTEFRCFAADSLCVSYSNASRTAADDGSVDVGVILGVVLPLLVLLGILIAAFVFWRRRQKPKRHKGISEIWLGDYKVWRTKISDKFSRLARKEVSVLFCFLCSDSGPPDFTDTEWLDMLNEIRQEVFQEENPVTREEAQQTLDRLKSRDYLWEDEDKNKITEDIKDETMYRIALIHRRIPFYYCSYDTASVYMRLRGYDRKHGEKCVSSNVLSDWDSLLIRRLQMNILTHVTMEDTRIYDKIHRILNVSYQKQWKNKDKTKEFLIKLRREGEAIHYRGSVDCVTWLWKHGCSSRPDIVRSCIGLYPHWDIYIIDNKPYRKPSKYNYSENQRSFLYSILLCDKYTSSVNGDSSQFNSMLRKIRERYFKELSPSNDIDVKQLQHVVNETQNNEVTFVSDDIRHVVMYTFVTECLVDDSDLEFLLTTASRDVISEYCRLWNYNRSEGERCLYVPDRPEKMYDLFIDNLQLDIITHCTVSDESIHNRISQRLNVPQEVLRWDIDARERFVKISKLGSKKVFRARGMIVGCAGAGKTTLLRKLHGTKRTYKDSASVEETTLPGKIQRRKKTDEDSAEPEKTFLLKQRHGAENTNGNKPTESTVGLEVHEDLFVIEDNELKDFCPEEANIENQYLDNNLISMTDFAGQVAYYACHQVYLSRRAFYIVVIDMSKKLKEECRLYDTDRHNPTGSLFHSWTYKDYFHFWLQTINTYCNDGTQRDPKDTTEIKDSRANVNHDPVILVASHKDQLRGILQTSDTFYVQLEASLSKKQTLKRLISPYRYFEVECPPEALSQQQQMQIDRVKKCIVDTVQKLPHWGEEVPLKWFELEKSLNNKKANGEKVLKRSELKKTAKSFKIDEDGLNDVLRFLHEIGKVIYFSVEKLKEIIIIDVQWFVDAFKYIISDEKHFARKDDSNILVNTGKITGRYIEQVWESIKDDQDGNKFYIDVNGKLAKHHDFLWLSYLNHKDDILQYMDKLGLMTRIEAQVGHGDEEEMYYIPSMNRTNLPENKKNAINKTEKSPMMVYFFKSYLPHFFFFRLVVNCLNKWEVFDEESFFKNAAFYKAKEAGHFFAIAVNKTSVQLQVFTCDETLNEDCVKKVRKTVEDMIKNITKTFHKGIIYDMGFSCKDITIADEDEDFFLKESEISQKVRTSKEMSCPRHFLGTSKHTIDTNKIRMCLLERNSTLYSKDN